MKKTILLISFVCTNFILFSQNDTIVKKDNKIIPCNITYINESTIFFDLKDGFGDKTPLSKVSYYIHGNKKTFITDSLVQSLSALKQGPQKIKEIVPEKPRLPYDTTAHKIQAIHNQLKSSKTSFISAGLFMVVGGALSIAHATSTPPSINISSTSTSSQIQAQQDKQDAYNANQKTLQVASSGCYMFAGLLLSFVVAIHFR